MMNAYISLMTAHVNANGKVDDALFCKEIAAGINAGTLKGGEPLWEFIYEFGEDMDDTYMGRDQYGEKHYHTFNPGTNWHERIRKELVSLGYYKDKNFSVMTVAT